MTQAAWIGKTRDFFRRTFAAESEISLLSLRFRDSEMEREFADVHFQEHSRPTRLYMALGMASYLSFGLLDLLFLGPEAGPVLAIRLATVACLGGLILALFVAGRRLGYHNITAAGLLIAGLGVVGMTAVMPRPENEVYYAGIILCVAYFSNLALLRFHLTAAVSAFLFVAYLVSAFWLNPVSPGVALANLFFLSGMITASLWTNYWHQFIARKDFAHATALRRQVARNQELLQKSQAANRAKSEFLAVMSHELRTPLNAVIGFSDLMRQEIHGPLGAQEYQRYLGDIHESGSHLLRLINDILDLSKAEAGKLELRDDAVDLEPLLRSACEMMMPLAKSGEVAVSIRSQENLPSAHVDERLTRQVMLNLLSNAIKFTPSGGRVTAGVREGRDGRLTVEVTDTGVGIAKEDIPRILEPFVQVDSSLNRQKDGTGLGLPLVRKIMEAHGGRLELDSEVGQGTAVRAIFPQSRTIREEARASAPAVPTTALQPKSRAI